MKKKIMIIGSILVVLLLISFVSLRFIFINPQNRKVTSKEKFIDEVYTDKCRYSPNEKVKLNIHVKNLLDSSKKGELYIYLRSLNDATLLEKVKFNVNKGEERFLIKEITCPPTDFAGYGIEVYAVSRGDVLDFKGGAIDVSSDWTKYPRYGYIANFPKMTKEECEKVIENLNKYHLNGVQFYDWQYKHEKPLAGEVNNPKEKWLDIANREIYGETVKAYIEAAHSKGMKAANYNLMYGGYYDYEKEGAKREWGLFKSDDGKEQDFHSLPSTWATSSLNVFNPENEGWQNYILKNEKEAMEVYKFDAFHVDTLGNRGILYDINGKKVDLAMTYHKFLQKAKTYLNKSIIFNPVNGYGELITSQKSPLDFLYKEIWPDKNGSYSSVKNAIGIMQEYSEFKKSVVLAAYMNYRLSSGEFNDNSVKLMDAVIFSNGGAHIELGDGGMLSNEYFPNKKLTMSDSLKKDLIKYYDFSVAYENLLRDGMKDCDEELALEKEEITKTGEAKKVWCYLKENGKYKTIQLINLTGCTNSLWRDDTGDFKTPEVKSDIKVKCYTKDDPKKVFLCSPDYDEGKSKKLSVKKGKDSKGSYIEFKIPKLMYWDMVYFEK